jgi:hypothetical protein
MPSASSTAEMSGVAGDMGQRLAQRNMHLPCPPPAHATVPPSSRPPFARVQPTTATAMAGGGVAWCGDGLLHTWPVDRRVGSPRNSRPELMVELVVGSGQGA